MVFRSVLILIVYGILFCPDTIVAQVPAPYQVTLHKPFRSDELTVDCIVYPASYL